MAQPTPFHVTTTFAFGTPHFFKTALKCGSGNIGTKEREMQMMKMQEWKHRHGPAGVENAEVEIIELQQQDNL